MGHNKNYVDESWAIWIDGDDTTTIYFNEWMNPRKTNYVDIAIRVRNIMQSNKMNLYIPFKIVENEIEDISLELKDEKILRATFSATCIIDFKKSAYTSEIAYNGKTIDLVHLDKKFMELKDIASGTIFSYDLSKVHPYLDNDECYFIFRVPHKSLNALFKPKGNIATFFAKIRDSFTTPVVNEKFGYSIRINEGRLIPQEINRIGAFHRQKLKKAVISIAIDEDYELNDSNCFRIRRLEKELYESYVPEKYNCDDVITYQWADSRKDNFRGSFNFYFNISREYISRTSMIIYMILLMIVGILGGTLWDLIKYLLGVSNIL